MTITFGSLFAGIGGFDLGFERAGMECRWQVEIDDYANRVLEKHWPNVKRWRDVRTFPQPGFERVDVICGGFPCQDISFGNHKAKGLDGERSGLWFEYERIIRVLRPEFVVVENVAALTFRGLDRVLWFFAKSGFDAEWQTIPATALGAPHERQRVFIVAYRPSKRREANVVFSRRPSETAREESTLRSRNWPGGLESRSSLPNRVRWCPDSELCRVAHGVPDELDRYRGLGNAVVPQVAEYIGRQIVEALQ